MRNLRSAWQALDKVERSLTVCITVLALFLVGTGMLLVRFLTAEQKEPVIQSYNASNNGQPLATPEDFLPDNLRLGEKAVSAVFSKADGEALSLDTLLQNTQYRNGVWILFWASWCPDCEEQLAYIDTMEALSKQYGYELILVDRLNPERESVEKATEKLEQIHATAKCVFDRDGICYSSWGMHEIPSSVVLDRDGTVMDYASGVITAGECEGMLLRAENGRASGTMMFLENNLLGNPGRVYTSFGNRTGEASPSGKDILCESQGLMLHYTLNCENRELFDRIWSDTQELLFIDGLPAWFAKENGQKADASALVDDMRIWSALQEAGNRWGEPYAGQADMLLQNIRQRELDRSGKLIDFFEFQTEKKASTIALNYLDLSTIRNMAKREPAFEDAFQDAIEILNNGLISEQFPLYYSSFDRRTGKYSKNDLNTVEALYTFWNLSRDGCLPEASLQWLRQRVKNGDLAARYSVTGEPISGYEYHSTAVYSLAALVAKEQKDPELFELSVRRMERLYIADTESEVYGAYTQPGIETFAFDQLLPLFVDSIIEQQHSV